LDAYEQIYPGAAKQLFDMAEREQLKRHELAGEEVKLARRGQDYALWVVVLFGVLIVLALLLDQPWVAVALGGATLVSLVIVFVTGERPSTDGE
jgi:uncharacterized membrane protein